jgi:hypothetical protein
MPAPSRERVLTCAALVLLVAAGSSSWWSVANGTTVADLYNNAVGYMTTHSQGCDGGNYAANTIKMDVHVSVDCGSNLRIDLSYCPAATATATNIKMDGHVSADGGCNLRIDCSSYCPVAATNDTAKNMDGDMEDQEEERQYYDSLDEEHCEDNPEWEHFKVFYPPQSIASPSRVMTNPPKGESDEYRKRAMARKYGPPQCPSQTWLEKHLCKWCMDPGSAVWYTWKHRSEGEKKDRRFITGRNTVGLGKKLDLSCKVIYGYEDQPLCKCQAVEFWEIDVDRNTEKNLSRQISWHKMDETGHQWLESSPPKPSGAKRRLSFPQTPEKK